MLDPQPTTDTGGFEAWKAAHLRPAPKVSEQSSSLRQGSSVDDHCKNDISSVKSDSRGCQVVLRRSLDLWFRRHETENPSCTIRHQYLAHIQRSPGIAECLKEADTQCPVAYIANENLPPSLAAALSTSSRTLTLENLSLQSQVQHWRDRAEVAERNHQMDFLACKQISILEAQVQIWRERFIGSQDICWRAHAAAKEAVRGLCAEIQQTQMKLEVATRTRSHSSSDTKFLFDGAWLNRLSDAIFEGSVQEVRTFIQSLKPPSNSDADTQSELASSSGGGSQPAIPGPRRRRKGPGARRAARRKGAEGISQGMLMSAMEPAVLIL